MLHGKAIVMLVPFYHRAVTPGEVGCAASHFRVWLDEHRRGLDAVVVLEDDVVVDAAALQPVATESSHPGGRRAQRPVPPRRVRLVGEPRSQAGERHPSPPVVAAPGP